MLQGFYIDVENIDKQPFVMLVGVLVRLRHYALPSENASFAQVPHLLVFQLRHPTSDNNVANSAVARLGLKPGCL